VAAEVFATTLDVYLALGLVPEDDNDRNTADGRPATRRSAHIRLARMLCGDADNVSDMETSELARAAMDRQRQCIGEALRSVLGRMPEPPKAIVISGSGEFLARSIVSSMTARIVSLGDLLGRAVSDAACAYAVALLAKAAT
jgi:uncharacterized hydantoinase/oxoprolinase family protein